MASRAGANTARGSTTSRTGGSSSQGRGYSDNDFVPHRIGSSSRESEHRYGSDYRSGASEQQYGSRYGSSEPRYGSGGDWGSSGQDRYRQGNEPSFGSSGSYGRSQGAGSFGGGNQGRGDYGGGYRGDEGRGYGGHYATGTGPDWSTGGGYGGDTSFGPRSGWSSGASGGGQSMRESYAGRGPKDYKRSDDRIREDVSDRLEQDHGVDASDISVQVQNGEVTLTGTVNSRDQKRRAEDCAEAVNGVKEVTNNLRVNRSDSRSQQAPVSETSSSILGLGGQKSRELEDGTATTSSEGRSTPVLLPRRILLLTAASRARRANRGARLRGPVLRARRPSRRSRLTVHSVGAGVVRADRVASCRPAVPIAMSTSTASPPQPCRTWRPSRNPSIANVATCRPPRRCSNWNRPLMACAIRMARCRASRAWARRRRASCWKSSMRGRRPHSSA